MRRFKFLRSVGRTYQEQLYITGCCQTYETQTPEIRQRIREKCESAGGDYADALRCWLTTDADWVWVCREFAISDRTLYRIRNRFYTMW